MVISYVVERLARPHLVRLVQQGKPFPDFLINRLLIWKQRKPQKPKQFIINITPTIGSPLQPVLQTCTVSILIQVTIVMGESMTSKSLRGAPFTNRCAVL